MYLFFLFLFFSFLVISSSLFGREIVSAYAVNCEDGSVVLDQNSDISLTPASCMKIVTTGAALHLLDPNSRFETHLEYDGGNIYIRGEGDPCLGSDRLGGWKKQIDMWADAIQALGIQRIQGKVIADATKWEKALAIPSWSWEDVGNYYGVGASALSFHENMYSLVFQPGTRVGTPTQILRTDPPLKHLQLENEVTTGPDGSGDCACIYGSEYSPLQHVRGTIPFGVSEFVINGAIPDPAMTCSDLLIDELHHRKISIEQKPITPQKKTSIHTTYSPTIKEIVFWTNQESVNLYAEHLVKKIGQGSTQTGIQAITDFWKSQKIDSFHMVDGSGLSRKNCITTKQLVAVLQKMKSSRPFLESLNENGKIRAKSGSMSLIKGYAGYCGNIAFAIIVNNCPNSQKKNEIINSLLSEVHEN